MFNFLWYKQNSLQEETHQNMTVPSYNQDNQLDVVIIEVSFAWMFERMLSLLYLKYTFSVVETGRGAKSHQ